MSWEDAEAEWLVFLKGVETAQTNLHCALRNAWFRGHEDTQYILRPSILRDKWRNIGKEERPDLEASEEIELKELISRLKQEEQLKIKLKKKLNYCYLREIDDPSVRESYADASRKVGETKLKIQKLKSYKPLLRLGERDAFINYCYRSFAGSQSSWVTLAEMQHHKVPTRLLDWTDSLAMALYFALRRHRLFLEKYWFEKSRQSGSDSLLFPVDRPFDELPIPCVWILNPYYLSRIASNRNRVWHLSLDPDFDYYNCFIERKKWAFELPIPSFIDWNGERIAAQRGMFTVWGYDHSPLDKIPVPNGKMLPFVGKVELTQLGALYAVRHLKILLGMDRYSTFRDRDALGAKIRREFLYEGSTADEYFD